MSTGTDRYQSPLSERYASKEMQYMPLSHIVPTSYTPIVTPQCFSFKYILQDYKRKSV